MAGRVGGAGKWLMRVNRGAVTGKACHTSVATPRPIGAASCRSSAAAGRPADGAPGRSRTTDTTIFSRLLYH